MSVIHTYSEIIFEISEDPEEAKAQIDKVSEIFGHEAAPDSVTKERLGLMRVLCVKIPIIGEEMTRKEILSAASQIDYFDGYGVVPGNKEPSTGNTHALMLQPL